MTMKLLLLYARRIETLERKIEMKEAEKNEVASA